MILRVIHESKEPVGSRFIARKLQEKGICLSERTVRYHLRLLDERGLTRLMGKRDGRVITEKGIDELGKARVQDKVGMVISRIEILSFQTTFDPDSGKGYLPVNVSLFPEDFFGMALEIMRPVFSSGFVVSDRVKVAEAGCMIGGIKIPKGQVAVATVCSLVVNGVLLKNGIPMDSKFGGILQVRDGRPLRFVELISYAGSSLDPSEVFIRGKMTDVNGAALRGDGMILANFREIPGPCYHLTQNIISRLARWGIRGVLAIGRIGEPVCQVPVDVSKLGLILIGGLNPPAAAYERGVPVENYAMSTVLDYSEMLSFEDVFMKFKC
ncbi:MAG: NrpR regulatory domain-containing protein [Syntrophales bacterium]|nr:NrpR regulatory domain-containing protein [Syntrophales bacterium]